MNKRGFTLIELLLVISIISLIASIFTANSTEAREKADDSYKQLQVKEVEKAILLHKNEHGYVPANYTPESNEIATEGTAAYASSMQELVDKGYLPSIPKSKKGDEFSYWASPEKTEAFFGAKLSKRTTSQKSSCPATSLVPYEDCVDGVDSAPADYTVKFYMPADVVVMAELCTKHGQQNSCRPNADNSFPSLTCYGWFQDGQTYTPEEFSAVEGTSNQKNDLSLTALSFGGAPLGGGETGGGLLELTPDPGGSSEPGLLGPFCFQSLGYPAISCKPKAESACSGADNDYCGCIN